MIADARLIAARARAEASKRKLDASIEHAKARLSPAALASDAVDGVRSKASELATNGVEVVRQRPAIAAAALAAVGVLIARKPIARMVGRRNADDDETAAA